MDSTRDRRIGCWPRLAVQAGNGRLAPSAGLAVCVVLCLLLGAGQVRAGQTGFSAQDGEIDVSSSSIASGNFGARRDTIPGWQNWGNASSSEISALRNSDDVRYRTGDAGSGDNSAMLFEYRFDDDPDGVDQVNISIEVSQAYAFGSIYVFLWDWDAGRYVVLGSMSGTFDRTLSFSLTSAPSRFVSLGGQLTLFVVNQDDYGSQAYVKVDRVEVELVSLTPHFSISHSGSVTTCDRAEITITKHLADHQVDRSYSGLFKIGTSTGGGTFSLIEGNGELETGTGGARYAFGRGDEGSVKLGLVHSEIGTVTFEMSDGEESQAASENPSLTVTPPGESTYRDEFSSTSYSGNNGSENFSGPWVEVGESNGVSANSTTVSSGRCVSGRCLRIGTGFSSRETFSNRGVRREANLSSASSATLSFQYLRGYVQGTGTASVAISNDGGANFRTLATYTLNGNTTSPISQSFDITDYISSNTQIRFLASASNATTSIYVDNIQIRTESTCPANDYFLLKHDGAGVFCQDEPFWVNVLTGGDISQPSYAETVTLTTGTGVGTFKSDPSNLGEFSDGTANDGLARYVFSEKDGGVAAFWLNYDGEPSIDLDVYQSDNHSIEDDDRAGLLVFGPAGFWITSQAVPDPAPSPISDPIGAQTAGAPFTAFASAAGAGTCGITDGYSGEKEVLFWYEYVDPGSGTRAVAINNTFIGRSEADATPVRLEFSKGRASFVATYKDVGSLRIHLKDPTGGGEGDPILGTSNTFVSRPAGFEILNIERPDLSDNPRTEVSTGEVFVAAGEPFRVTVRVLDADKDLTPNFGLESRAEGIRLTSRELIAPAGGRNGVLGDGAIGNASNFVPSGARGTFLGTAFSFDEVGAIRLQASIADGDYLGSGDVLGSTSEVVGRFTPSRFEATVNTPEWETGCRLGAFTWAGQPFGYASGRVPQVSVRAVNAAGLTTQNYAGSWWRLTTASLDARRYSTNAGVLNESGLPTAATDPVVSIRGAGEGSLAFSSGAGATLTRTPFLAPFELEVQLSVGIRDLDGVAYAENPLVFGGTDSGSGMSFSVSKRIQFGRLRVENAFGSELLDLPAKLVAQRFDGTRFVDDDNDSCTRISESDLRLTPTPASLVSTPSIANQPLLTGDSGLSMSAPNLTGTIGIQVDLGTSGANAPWLRFDWPSDGNLDGVLDDDPEAEVTFGIWAGRPHLIYQREVY